MVKGAILSSCRRYRYSLWRSWVRHNESSDYAMFVGLNPSTADENEDDPTIRRCVNFAKSWGYSGLVMTNLFAYRATDPNDMFMQVDPIGEDNDRYLLDLAKDAGVVVAAWGVYGTHMGRHNAVRRMLPSLHYLRLTKNGHPGHPLYLPKTLRPTCWVSQELEELGLL